jgi:hypothetical protein
MEKTNRTIANRDYVQRWYATWRFFGGFFGAAAVPAAITFFFAFALGNPPQGQELPGWGFAIMGCGMLLAVLLFLIGLFGRVTIVISRRIKYKIWSADYHPEW